MCTRYLQFSVLDDASGPDTDLRCTIICSENEYISNHTCQACPVGTYNAAGDPASGPDTVCDVSLCNHNYHVSDHESCSMRTWYI